MVDLATRRLPAVATASWLKALPPAARFAFFGGVEAQTAAQRVWGAGFSQEACRAIVQGARATLWMGPEEYLLLHTVSESGADSLLALEQALAAHPHSLVDVSHRQYAVEICGPHAADILNGACPLDLDPGAFPVGMCTRTVLAKADIVLWRTHDQAFHVEMWRSFAGYVGGVLHEIAAEFYPRR